VAGQFQRFFGLRQCHSVRYDLTGSNFGLPPISLPKTRSGKIMRRVIKSLLTHDELGDISTIE
jgi:hypothetical protein